MTVRDLDTLPAQYRSDTSLIGKCATEIFLDAAENFELLTLEQQRVAKDYMARPSRAYSHDSPDGHFKIHYDETGTHAVPSADDNGNGVPDFVEWLADYADSSWRCIHDNLSYDLPPVDGGAGGDDKYDIKVPLDRDAGLLRPLFC